MDLGLSISHTLLCYTCVWFVLEMASVELRNDVSLIVFKLPPQIFNTLVLVRTAIVLLEISSKARRD